VGARKRIKIFQLSSQVVGKPYKAGGQGLNGMDCFTLILDYLRKLGENIPSDIKYKGYTLESYYSAYEKNPDVLDVGIEFIASKTQKISTSKIIAGDILVITNKDGVKSTVIDGGNGNIIAATKRFGVTILNRSHFEVIRAFRWQPPQLDS
jgi:hypothetical protein